jgi:phosphoribosylamine---glycine ligase
MKILILGSGGRECAFAWKMSQSNLCSALFIAPGNGGTKNYGQNIQISPNDFPAVERFCIDENIKLVVVGPEDPLVNGIVDYFQNSPSLQNVHIIGPDKTAAQLEGSKSFAKAFMKKYDIPTAAYEVFTPQNHHKASEFLLTLNPPYVIKADGLAAGKGVLICQTLEEANNAVDEILIDKKFGNAGNSLVIEEFLHGIELSAFVLTDGLSYLIFPEAKDYKRIGDGDTGLNTGGMGTVSPVPFADEVFMQKVKTLIVEPTIQGIAAEQMHYCGFIFVGLMNVNGNPMVIEYNVRMGDPETQSVLPRIDGDLTELLIKAAQRELRSCSVSILPKHVVNVVLASGGYPGDFEKGKAIHLPEIELI